MSLTGPTAEIATTFGPVELPVIVEFVRTTGPPVLPAMALPPLERAVLRLSVEFLIVMGAPVPWAIPPPVPATPLSLIVELVAVMAPFAPTPPPSQVRRLPL